MECVQTDNGFEFTNRFSRSQRNLETLFEATARQLGIRHKLIRPYTPRHNGKVERSHREDQKHFYDMYRFFSLAERVAESNFCGTPLLKKFKVLLGSCFILIFFYK